MEVVKRLILLLAFFVAAAGAGVGGAYYFRPRALDLAPGTETPEWRIEEGRQVVTLPGSALLAEVAVYDDELYAYFSFDYLRSRTALKPAEVLLTMRTGPDGTRYPVLLRPENDITAALPFLEDIRRQGYIPGFSWRFVPESQLGDYQLQTRTFVTAYNLPVDEPLERLSQSQKHEIVRRFVVFKSRTDPRVRKGIQPVPPTLTDEEANQIATDIITVADFFWLPLDYFLGIGAMENNYMNVTGDLNHAVWKRSPARDDTVLRRRGDRALVLNSATGVWQITRETLRASHRIYLKRKWDYSLLPERLRPPRTLNVNKVEAGHLTTYAGLLFRELIDRFGGDLAQAVGAYNGGPGNPNMRYENGVRMVANYARRMLEQAGRLGGEEVADMQFLAPAR